MAHSTNYTNTLITVSGDYKYDHAVIAKSGTIGAIQLDFIVNNPYQMTSDDLLFSVHALRNKLNENDANLKNEFFDKPLACLRASPLVKTLGYGIHHDQNSKIAVFPIESADYKGLLEDNNIQKVAGMRSKRA
ncbi:MAG: hypothetical protein J0L55_03240 [Caulobacterales bacterium]|nr:hypothetical protein [Caulobacterales bacterium]MCA0371733.1 DUF6157 family protein [Pseudomonadota bacterium]